MFQRSSNDKVTGSIKLRLRWVHSVPSLLDYKFSFAVERQEQLEHAVGRLQRQLQNIAKHNELSRKRLVSMAVRRNKKEGRNKGYQVLKDGQRRSSKMLKSAGGVIINNNVRRRSLKVGAGIETFRKDKLNKLTMIKIDMVRKKDVLKLKGEEIRKDNLNKLGKMKSAMVSKKDLLKINAQERVKAIKLRKMSLSPKLNVLSPKRKKQNRRSIYGSGLGGLECGGVAVGVSVGVGAGEGVGVGGESNAEIDKALSDLDDLGGGEEEDKRKYHHRKSASLDSDSDTLHGLVTKTGSGIEIDEQNENAIILYYNADSDGGSRSNNNSNGDDNDNDINFGGGELDMSRAMANAIRGVAATAGSGNGSRINSRSSTPSSLSQLLHQQHKSLGGSKNASRNPSFSSTTPLFVADGNDDLGDSDSDGDGDDGSKISQNAQDAVNDEMVLAFLELVQKGLIHGERSGLLFHERHEQFLSSKNDRAPSSLSKYANLQDAMLYINNPRNGWKKSARVIVVEGGGSSGMRGFNDDNDDDVKKSDSNSDSNSDSDSDADSDSMINKKNNVKLGNNEDDNDNDNENDNDDVDFNPNKNIAMDLHALLAKCPKGEMQLCRNAFILPHYFPPAIRKSAAASVNRVAVSRTSFKLVARSSVRSVTNPGGYLTIRPLTALNVSDNSKVYVKLR